MLSSKLISSPCISTIYGIQNIVEGKTIVIWVSKNVKFIAKYAKHIKHILNWNVSTFTCSVYDLKYNIYG